MSPMSTKEFGYIGLIVVFLGINGLDLFTDYSDGVGLVHLIHEGVFILLSLGVLVWLVTRLLSMRRQLARLASKLDQAKSVSLAASQDILDSRTHLNDVVKQQFSEWKLSNSEAEVGRLLLKGLSIREIAEVRHTQEKTVRSQASSIYRKASLEGRHAFAAWFLEEIS